MTQLAERLGYGPDDRLLILTCDNLGRTHAANVAVYEAVNDGLATGATLMVPCPWAREAAARYRGEDVGVHLTLNSELDTYRWGPITQAPSLLDGDGGFPRTPSDLWDHGDTDEVRRECRAQIERAILWGFDVTHLDSHLGAMIQRPEFFDIYLELAIDFALPLRLGADDAQANAGFPFRQLAKAEGIVSPDHVVTLGGGPTREALAAALSDLAPGVTEICLQPAIETPEIKAVDSRWQQRVAEHELITRDREIAALVEASGASMVSYRSLRRVQNAG